MTDTYRQRAEAIVLQWLRYNYRHEFDSDDLELVAAIEAALRACAAEALAWQPIATAPKDGTEVVLTDGRTYKRVGNWARRRECWAVDTIVSLNAPTHWTPIPPQPPARADEQE